MRDVASVIAHPKFNLATMLAHRATADVALLKLAAPLARVEPAALHGRGFTVAPGDGFTVAGTGVAVRRRRQVRRQRARRQADRDRAAREPCRSACSIPRPAARGRGSAPAPAIPGGPVFGLTDGRPAIIGVVSWSTGPRNSDGCGGLTGVTPLTLYREWIRGTAKILGNQL